MCNTDVKLSEVNTHIADLVKTALNQDHLSGLSDVLKSIARAMDAYGCILWEVAPSSELNTEPPSGFFFVLAQWFEDDSVCALHDLPLDSATGKAVLSGEPVIIKDIYAKDSGVYLNHRFLREAQIKTMCCVPIRFRDAAHGAINLYRNTNIPFTNEDMAQVRQLASLVAALYGTIRDQVSFQTIQRINTILHEAEVRLPRDLPDKKEMTDVLKRICNLVGETFQCIETSIFFNDRLETPGMYSLIATTWPWLERFWKNIYRKGDSGLTGWVLTNIKPVRIFDLVHFERDKEIIDRYYPGLVWNDSLKIESAVREHLDLDPEADLQPLSFMAVPIVMGEEVLGVIRCCAAKQGPYYFASREEKLLKVIAAQIGQYWNNWLNRREMQDEIESWQALVKSVSKLNSLVRDQLMEQEDYKDQIFERALEDASSIIKGAEIMDIRLLDKEKGELFFAYMNGSAWEQGSREVVQERKNRRFRINNGQPKSAGAYVIQTGATRLIENVEKDDYYSQTFPDTKRLIVAPIKVEDETFGVLDIRGTGAREFPRHAEHVASLLGQQLGLYHHLADTIHELRRVKSELEGERIEQTQIFQDLGHQLKSPLNQAYIRIHAILTDEYVKLQSILRTGLVSDKFQSSLMATKLRLNLTAARGLCGKARQVITNTRLFASLAREQPIYLDLSKLVFDELIKMLIEAATDNRVMARDSHLRFFVDTKTFKVLRSLDVYVDIDLLEQAINTVLDNARKYSYEYSRVRVYGGMMRTGEFHISVSNIGIPIREEDVEKCIRRGWRSEEAQSITGEGSGIGLWIVQHIMDAHNGELRIASTTIENITDVKLIFPSSRTL